jgi:hypothetical protein
MKGVHHETSNGKPEMKIYLENNIYFPGETIRGHLFLKSGNFLRKGIIIYDIFGYQKFSEVNKYKVECKKSTNIYHISLEYPGLVNYSIIKGIKIPFEIKLPSNILPSFEYSINNKNYGYIKIFLHIKITELKLMKQKFIIIRRPMKQFNTPLIFQSEKNENILGIINKGCPILKASYDKNYFFLMKI